MRGTRAVCTTGLWVPIIRSWALTRGFALHPGTRNRYEIRYTRTQHRPPSRQANDHGRVSGTHRLPDAATQGSGYGREAHGDRSRRTAEQTLGGGGPASHQLRSEASEYAAPVLGLIFLRHADERFAKASETVRPGSARGPIGPVVCPAFRVGGLFDLRRWWHGGSRIRRA